MCGAQPWNLPQWLALNHNRRRVPLWRPRRSGANRNGGHFNGWVSWAGMAASFAVTLSLGMYLQHLRRPVESGGSPTRAGSGAAAPGIEMVQGDGPSRQPNNGAFVFPLPSEATSSPGLSAAPAPIMPDAVRQALEQAGHRIQQQRVYVPVDLPDGRRAYVPIDRVDVLPAGAAPAQ